MEIKFIFTCLIGIAPFIWTTYKYFDVRKRDQNIKEFEIYHQLIKDLVESENGTPKFIDRQAAIVYELKNFKRYHTFSYRTLLNLKRKWKEESVHERLLEEIDMAIIFLENNFNKNFSFKTELICAFIFASIIIVIQILFNIHFR